MEGHKINTAPEFVLTDNLKAHRGLIMSEVPERRRFRKGQQLSRGGTPSPQVYFILEGAARRSFGRTGGDEGEKSENSLEIRYFKVMLRQRLNHIPRILSSDFRKVYKDIFRSFGF